MHPPQFEVEAGDLAAVRALEARRRDALSDPPPYDDAHTLLLKYRCDPNDTLSAKDCASSFGVVAWRSMSNTLGA